MITYPKPSPDGRPSFEEMALHVRLADAIRAERKVEWDWPGGTSGQGTLRHGVWTDDLRLSRLDPRDDHIRITTRTGLEMTMRWSKAIELLGDSLMYLG